MSIFQKSVLQSIKQDESLVALRWAKYQDYLSKVEAIKSFKEEYLTIKPTTDNVDA